MNRLMIVVPCFNEQEVLPLTIPALTQVVEGMIKGGKIAENSGFLLVNDGSRDNTWQVIENAHKENKYVYGLCLAGNVGHQNALLAGLEAAVKICDLTVSIDADLQDDVAAIEKMVDCYINGADVVYGVRSERKNDSLFKRKTAQGFYKTMNLLGAKTVYNHADFRLMSKRAVEQLLEYKERNVFLRGIVPLMNLKSETVYYSRGKRVAGESKYPFKKMLSFAWEGISSFSTKPLTIIAFLGGVITLCAVIAFIYIMVSYFLGNTSPGWPSLMASIWFLGGVQLFSIGVVGQYVGKTYIESKSRPRYFVDKFLNHDDV
ncbi:MAG: glycosyltransferase family 2 protein [Clostridia bacterium]|nr:glycosyltransferase family 2 protein [Clostridia bacterium]